MIPQKLEIIVRLESGKSQKEVLASYNSRLSTIYDTKKCKDKLQLFMESNESVKNLFKQYTLKD
jgi:hypothetical protein